MRYFMAGLVFWSACTALPAQWLKIKTPGIPRQADGKPELTAPAPRTPDGKPDLSGLWSTEDNTYFLNLTGDLKPGETRSWAEEVYKNRVDALDRDTPATHCLPGGPTAILAGQYRVIQAPNLIGILYESGAYRQIFTDGRELPKDPNPTWWGYSVGHWEGDILVAQTVGFNDRSWLDFSGHPHTEELRVTERFQRRDFGHMQLQLTLEDPKTFTKPITVTLAVNFVPDTEMLEYVCNENEKDSVHLVGKASDEVKGEVKLQLAGVVPMRRKLSGAGTEDEGHDHRSRRATDVFDRRQGGRPADELIGNRLLFLWRFPDGVCKGRQRNGDSFLLHTACGDFKFVRSETANP